MATTRIRYWTLLVVACGFLSPPCPAAESAGRRPNVVLILAGERLDEATVSIEGPAWLLQDLPSRWQDPLRRERIMTAMRAVEQEPSLLGVSAHLLAVARKESRTQG
jgi:hypothetical protein